MFKWNKIIFDQWQEVPPTISTTQKFTHRVPWYVARESQPFLFEESPSTPSLWITRVNTPFWLCSPHKTFCGSLLSRLESSGPVLPDQLKFGYKKYDFTFSSPSPFKKVPPFLIEPVLTIIYSSLLHQSRNLPASPPYTKRFHHQTMYLIL